MSLESIFVSQKFHFPETMQSILKEWISILSEYCKPYDGSRDVPYWYGERPLTGLVAAAAWRINNGWALEEFNTIRGIESGGTPGRGDLWIGIGKETYTIEAKITWPEGDLESAKERVNFRLKEATKQLHDIDTANQEGTPVSVCYVVPWPKVFETVEKAPNYSQMLTKLVSYFQIEGFATALFIPDEAPLIEKGRVYPGVALIAKTEKWPI